MRISVAMMHHPARPIRADLAALNPVIVDDRERSHWDTGRRAWEVGLTARSDWHLVVEDDVQPTNDLLAGLPALLSEVPWPNIVSLFGIRKHLLTALEAGCSFVVEPAVCWNQAILMPTALIERWLAWDRAHVRESKRGDKDDLPTDDRISLFLLHQNPQIRVWYTLPCLVEHVGEESLLGHPTSIGGRPRVAAAFFPRTAATFWTWKGPTRWEGGKPFVARLGNTWRKDGS